MILQILDGFVEAVQIIIGFAQIKKAVDHFAFCTFLQIGNRFAQFSRFIAAGTIPEVIVGIRRSLSHQLLEYGFGFGKLAFRKPFLGLA